MAEACWKYLIITGKMDVINTTAYRPDMYLVCLTHKDPLMKNII
jgi:hypothetical protein